MRPANNVTINRNFFVCKKDCFSSSAHPQLLSAPFLYPSFWYQARPKTKTVRAIKYGRKGSIHEKAVAIPLVPAIKARTGAIQHKEAAIAVTTPPKAILFVLFLVSSILSGFF